MRVIAVTSVLLLIVIQVRSQTDQLTKCSDTNIQKLCLHQDTCDECLQANPCCNWCYDGNYVGRKCNVASSLGDCNQKKIETNSDSGSEIPEGGDRHFTDGDAAEIVQIKPQLINIILGKDLPVNFTFTYKPAKHYPMDLYYLGDLSVSMREHLTIFKTLGADLPNNLTQLTKNYRLAYGSFLDKLGMPFYFTSPDSYEKPCLNLLLDDCEKGYLFRHRLDFTKDTGEFVEKVSTSKITANVDDLDGALDAILQILACDEKMGWSVNSRKIILLPTDSLLHTAGDGLLVGAVLRPTGACLVDDDGNHMSPLTYDYPSVGQIHELLRLKKVNIIFAVKDKVKLQYYKNLTSELLTDSAFVGELEEDSNNILQLINKGYYNFARQVSFSINTTMSENLDVKFFVDCEGHGILNETSTCYNVEEKAVEFTVQLTLKGAPTKRSEMLYIEEKNINEQVALNITYIGLCECKNYEGESLKCKNGTFRCGQCMCYEGWTGTLCDESCDEDGNFDSCRLHKDGSISAICHRNGDCVCGKCRCDSTYTGEYCEYTCPMNNGLVCSGVSQGRCVEGKCECMNDFSGEDCSCSTLTSHCKISKTMNICSGQGDCVCNKCECRGAFSGQYCELNKNNNTICDDYKGFVEGAVANNTFTGTKDNSKVLVEQVDEGKRKSICENTSCETVTYAGNSRCTVVFCYHSGQDGVIHLLSTPSCSLTAGLQMLTTGAVAFVVILLAGLLMICLTKYKIYREEQAEYKKFENAQRDLNELNPIYKDPVTSYRNPMRTKND